MCLCQDRSCIPQHTVMCLCQDRSCIPQHSYVSLSRQELCTSTQLCVSVNFVFIVMVNNSTKINIPNNNLSPSEQQPLTFCVSVKTGAVYLNTVTCLCQDRSCIHQHSYVYLSRQELYTSTQLCVSVKTGAVFPT
jgi:hypothetical protein